MTMSPRHAWLSFAPLAFLLAVLLGMAAPGASAPERGVGASYRGAATGARIARPGSTAQGAVVAAAQALGAANARPHGAPVALVARVATLDAERRAFSSQRARASLAPASRPSAYDPRGPPSTTA
jgi:hypothetical protein